MISNLSIKIEAEQLDYVSKDLSQIKDFEGINLQFQGIHKYKIRKTRFATSFGIYINK